MIHLSCCNLAVSLASHSAFPQKGPLVIKTTKFVFNESPPHELKLKNNPSRALLNANIFKKQLETSARESER
jgi:hypothetical protein